MSMSKEDFMDMYLPETITSCDFVKISLDETDLSIADILRNLNKTLPVGTRKRNAIAKGNYAVFVLCQSKLISPLDGLLLILTTNDISVEVISRNYVVMSIPEDKITNDLEIKLMIDNITTYMIRNFHNCLYDFNAFYCKYIYDMTDLRLLEQGEYEYVDDGAPEETE